MKSKFNRILSAFALVFLLALPAMAQTKIATVELSKVLDKYWKREQAEAVLDQKKADLEKDLKSMDEEFNKAKKEYTNLLFEAKDPTLTQEERDKRKNSADQKLVELRNRDEDFRMSANSANEQIRLQMQQLGDTLMQEIRAAVNAKAKTAGYSMVIDVSAVSMNRFQAPVVLYTNGENDITEEILKQLNAAAPTSITKATAPKSQDNPEAKKDDKK